MKTKRFLFLITLTALVLSMMRPLSLPVRADDTDYGKAAYENLQYLTEHFPKRVNYTEVLENQDNKVEAGKWIDTLMRSYGYQGYTIDGDLTRNHGNPVKSYCYFKQGKSLKKIVIGAHYDSVLTEGCEDNGTGVSVLLELAKRFSDVTTELSLEFCFWDGEEFLSEAGSFSYVSKAIYEGSLGSIQLYINLDCVGSGDRLYAYGGEYENGSLVRDWGYNMAITLSKELGIDLNTIPDNITRYKAPTRTDASDQIFFADQHVPYVYFEANAWVDKDGNEGNPAKPYNYNTTDPGVIPTKYTWANGQVYETTKGMIIHSQMFDNLSVLEGMFPGRIKRHMAETSEIVTRMLKSMTLDSPNQFRESVYRPAAPTPETEPAVTEAPTENPTEAPTETEPETTTEAPTEAASSEENTTEADSTEDGPAAPEGSSQPEESSPAAPFETPAASDGGDSGSPYGPVNAPTIIAVIFILALWGLWAYIYLRYYR